MTVIDFSLGTIRSGYEINSSVKADTNAKSILSYASDLKSLYKIYNG